MIGQSFQNNSRVAKRFNIWVFFSSSIWFFLIALIILRVFVFQQVSVVGSSMEPNYQTGELLFVNQLGDNFKRGQVVAAYDNENIAAEANYLTRFNPGTKFLLKRIIALPGEEIEMVDDKVIIYNEEFPDGFILQEDYISDSVRNQQIASDFYFPKTKVTADHYFLMGDNRTNSTDSRRKGSFASFSILGYETIRFWPLAKLQLHKTPEYDFLEIDDITKSKIQSRNSEQTTTILLQPKNVI
jgi:signal peptidase I